MYTLYRSERTDNLNGSKATQSISIAVAFRNQKCIQANECKDKKN